MDLPHTQTVLIQKASFGFWINLLSIFTEHTASEIHSPPTKVFGSLAHEKALLGSKKVSWITLILFH